MNPIKKLKLLQRFQSYTIKLLVPSILGEMYDQFQFYRVHIRTGWSVT